VALPAGGRVATSTGHADQLAAGAENVPAFITRRILADRLAAYYGPGKSFSI
jgi:hypothetical protein